MSSNSIYVGLSRMTALRRSLDVVANNVANVSTPAFKGESMLFQQEVERFRPGRNDDVSFVIDRSTYRDLREGPLSMTGNPLDVAIRGSGYFRVETPEGDRFTRDGRFLKSEDGSLVTTDGHRVQGDAGPIVIPQAAASIVIGNDGVVTADGAQVGRLATFSFQDEQSLVRGSSGLYEAPQGTEPQPSEGIRIIQGAVEQSNVQAVVEITRLVEVTREYDRISRFVEQSGDLQRNAVSRIGGRAN